MRSFLTYSDCFSHFKNVSFSLENSKNSMGVLFGVPDIPEGADLLSAIQIMRPESHVLLSRCIGLRYQLKAKGWHQRVCFGCKNIVGGYLDIHAIIVNEILHVLSVVTLRAS